MFTIHLNKLCFFSFHGLYEEERILGNTFEVTVAIIIDDSGKITELKQTINYESVYLVVKERMNKPTPLLETLAQDLVQLIHATDDRIKSISVAIEKIHPPLNAFEGSVGVTYKKDFLA